MRWTRPLFLLALVLLVAHPARSDWSLGQSYKWLQNPDTSVLGIDVNASYNFNLADDFLCTSPSLITGIHLWCSWYHDILPGEADPNAVTFILSIRADIPAGVGGANFSMPGEVLWEREFPPNSFYAHPWEQPINEGWLNPPVEYEYPGDQSCWQYNFFIPEDEAFQQMGSADEPVVYWLHVHAVPVDGSARFGWKTSVDHWNDDATWGMGDQPFSGPWQELLYPPGHEQYGQSIDLAFVLEGADLPPELDFGDAPDQNYHTLAASNGANHVITPNLLLGIAVDPEPDGQPSADALGDDIDLLYPSAGDDEDGVVFITPLVPGQSASVNVQDVGGGLLNAWIDFDGNGDWGGAGEQIFVDKPLSPGLNTLSFPVPASAIPRPAYARFRLSSLAGLSFDGAAPDGEVEDYLPLIEEPQTFKWIQNPDLEITGIDVNAMDPFVLADDFLCTQTGYISQIRIWGSWWHDQFPGSAIPDNVQFILSIHDDVPAVPGEAPSHPGEILWMKEFGPGTFNTELFADQIEEGWMDPPEDYFFPGDHQCWEYTFDIPVDEAFVQRGTEQTPIVYWLDVQAILVEPVAAAFGWKTSLNHWNDDAVWGVGQEPFPGPWNELIYPPNHQLAGHSIDLAFVLQGADLPPELDFGDAPDQNYHTLLASNGANHVITPNLLLGIAVDSEPDGQPSLDALGDDIDLFYPSAGDDEDGVVFTTPLIPGQPASVDVQDIGGGLLNVWIDLDGNGDWGGPGEQIFVDLALNPGLNTLPFAVPATAIPGPTYARFRLSSLAGLSFDGAAPDGEVEDYQVAIEEPQTFKWIQNPDLEYTGIDVDAQEPFVLADDFLCTQTGYLSQIRVWGSWRGDQFPGSAIPDNVQFVLSLHADVPAVAGQSPSYPGEVLWVKNFPPGTFQTALYADQIEEGWMDPPEDYAFPGDHQCWEYIFDIPVDEAFIQLGTEPAPIVYWLDVQAIPLDANAVFGWKTSLDHWNDDAVWGVGPEPFPGPWQELFYPPAHQFAGQSIDLAFSLINAPEPVAMDYGDAPDTYRTVLVSDGARHVIVPGIQLGHLLDTEIDGQPNAAATGDDLAGADDEDGVTFVSPLGVGMVTYAKVTASANGILNVWLDVDQNGTWTELYDHIVIDLPINVGANLVPIATPAFAQTGKTYMRFRYTSAPGISWYGPARDGEVEDYLVEVFTPTGNTSLPRPLHLNQNVPNPFNPNTMLSFDLPSKMTVRLAVYDLHGKLVRTLVDGVVDAGHHPVSWDGRSDEGEAVASGIYVARLSAGSISQTVKMTLLR